MLSGGTEAQFAVLYIFRCRIVGKMDEYQYPLFFEARDLTDRERGKVTRHFQKRKDSGGGECLTIAKAGAKTYKVCFKEKEGKESHLFNMI